MKPCERHTRVCTRPAAKGERYCKNCRVEVLAELREKKYLTPAPQHTGAWNGFRGGDARENTYETKNG